MRSRALRLWLFVSVLALALLSVSPRATSAPTPYVVIVNPRNPYTRLERKFVADAFLKKTTRWPDGEVIAPADLDADSPARERFSDEVLKRSVAAVKSYWQQVIFSGRDVPPPEFRSDEEVVKYVMKRTGGIGYVSGTASIGEAHVVVIR